MNTRYVSSSPPCKTGRLNDSPTKLPIGSVSETITVVGETPIVDVQSARRQTTLSNDVVRSIPNTRNYNSMVALVPGVITNINDVSTGIVTTQFPIHGGRANESRMTVDGLNIGNPPGGGQPPTYVADVGNAQEISFTSSGGLGESETAGLVMNLVPKTGGNRGSGAFFVSATGEPLESDNFTDEIKAAGLQAPTPINKVYDLNGSYGGPIKKDTIWYFVNARTRAAREPSRTSSTTRTRAIRRNGPTHRTGAATVHRSDVGERERA